MQLADFGVSRILNLDEQTHVVTQTHGTACFMPPEILKSGHMSAAADVYSFAMVMYQLYSRKVCAPSPSAVGNGPCFSAVRPGGPAVCGPCFVAVMILLISYDSCSSAVRCGLGFSAVTCVAPAFQPC